MPEGRESPPPEQLKPKQKDAPASGQGVANTAGKDDTMKKQLEHLESNPKGAMDDNLKDKYKK